MKTLFIIYTHNRPNIMAECLQTVFSNTQIIPTEVLISDDNSDEATKRALFDFCLNNSKQFPIHFMSFNSQQHIGRNFDFGLKYAELKEDVNFLIHIESDYKFRPFYLEEAIAVMEQYPLSVAMSAYSNPDYDNGKQETLFREVMLADFQNDPLKREFYHKPFKVKTDQFGEIECRGSSNSCGSFILNWQRVLELRQKYPEMEEKVFKRAANRQEGGNRNDYADGIISSGLSWYWHQDMEDRAKNELIEKDYYKTQFPWLDVCDFSLGNHYNAKGRNGNLPGLREGDSFVSSFRWDEKYLSENPRQISNPASK